MGYVYQRRWGAFWIGGITAIGAALLMGTGAAMVINALAGPGAVDSREDRIDLIGIGAVIGAYSGVLAVGVGSAVEAGLAVNRSRRRLLQLSADLPAHEAIAGE